MLKGYLKERNLHITCRLTKKLTYFNLNFDINRTIRREDAAKTTNTKVIEMLKFNEILPFADQKHYIAERRPSFQRTFLESVIIAKVRKIIYIAACDSSIVDAIDIFIFDIYGWILKKHVIYVVLRICFVFLR